jgi:hypothetical protein
MYYTTHNALKLTSKVALANARVTFGNVYKIVVWFYKNLNYVIIVKQKY